MAIRAARLAAKIDRNASEWTPARLHRVFLQHGCAVVRNVISQPVLERVREVVVDSYTKTGDLHVYDTDIRANSNGALSGFELVDVPLLRRLLALVYEGQEWREHNVAARRIEGTGGGQGWQSPLDLHLDCQIHPFEFTTNFWIPFQDCGVDSPVVQLLPIDYQRTRRYSGFTGVPLREGEQWHLGYFPEHAFDPSIVADEFGPECFYRPIMKPGDAIISSNWIIHGSYRTPAMKKGRMSVEVRFIGSKTDVRMPGMSFRARLAAAFGG